MRHFRRLQIQCWIICGVAHGWKGSYLHLSLVTSISPKRSRLPPLLLVPTEVAEAAEENVEKEVEGVWWRSEADGLRCLKLMMVMVTID